MLFFYHLQKPIAGLLLPVLFVTLVLGPVILFYPKPAKALFGDIVFDPWNFAKNAFSAVKEAIIAAYTIWEKGDTLLSRAMHVASQIFLTQLLSMITNDIIRWINGGGKPRFVSDWAGFLKNAADAAGGAFIDKYLGMGFLCEPFDLDIKIALLPEPTFDEKVRCTISDIVDNVEDFYENFENGGWRAWVKLVEPQNNIYGAYLMALDAKMGAEATAKEAAEKEALAGGGFLGARDEFGRIVTPGKLVSDLAGKVITQEIDLLREQIADLTDSLGPFEPYVVAIANAVINRVIREGFGWIGVGEGAEREASFSERYQSTGRPSDLPSLPPAASFPTSPSLSQSPAYYATQAEQDRNRALDLKENIEILKENLEKLKDQQDLSLGVLGQIKDKQEEILNQLQTRYVSGLNLPAWASVNKNILPNTDQIIASGIGTITVVKTGEDTYESGAPQPQTQARIDELQTGGGSADNPGRSEITSWIIQAGTAINATQDFINRCNRFLEDYEDYKAGQPTDRLEGLEKERQGAKKDAIGATQSLIGSTSNTLDGLAFETENTAYIINYRAITGPDSLESARGTSENPTVGTLYGELEGLNIKLGEIQ